MFATSARSNPVRELERSVRPQAERERQPLDSETDRVMIEQLDGYRPSAMRNEVQVDGGPDAERQNLGNPPLDVGTALEHEPGQIDQDE